MQRYRHKIGELQKHYVDRLNQIGFVWAPADRVWDDLYQRLVKYKGKHGDCDVPSSCPADPRLAHWVVNQRHRKKQGSLSDERVRLLTALGFRWAVYGKGQSEMTVEAKRKGESQPATEVEVGPEEHLYLVCGEYIQYGGSGPCPAKLEKYIKLHDGELPPCIILPCTPTVFRPGNPDSARVPVRKIKWSGKGRFRKRFGRLSAMFSSETSGRFIDNLFEHTTKIGTVWESCLFRDQVNAFVGLQKQASGFPYTHFRDIPGCRGAEVMFEYPLEPRHAQSGTFGEGRVGEGCFEVFLDVLPDVRQVVWQWRLPAKLAPGQHDMKECQTVAEVGNRGGASCRARTLTCSGG